MQHLHKLSKIERKLRVEKLVEESTDWVGLVVLKETLEENGKIPNG